MAKTSVGFGVALLVLGVVGYLATKAQHPTALIPAGVGVLLVLLGGLARKPAMRMHAMHGAALVALLGFAGSVSGLAQLPALLAGGTIPRPFAVIARSIMAVLCLAFVALTVRSFIAARIARRKASTPPS